MASSDGISRSYQKQYQYDPTIGPSVITLIDNRLDLIRDKIPNPDSGMWVNGFIKVFTCKVTIGAGSLPEVPMPNFTENDTAADTLTKQKAILWQNPAYRLVVYLADPPPIGQPTVWVEKVFFNLQNNFGFPYSTEQVLDALTTDIARDLPEGCKLGIAFEDIGHGLPKAQDKITFDVSWTAEYNWIKPYDVNISQPVVVQTATVQNVTQKNDSYTLRIGTTAQTILNANGNRLSGQLINNGANVIYFGLGFNPTATNNSGSVAASGGATPLPAGNKTSVAVIAAAGTANTVTASEVYNVAS